MNKDLIGIPEGFTGIQDLGFGLRIWRFNSGMSHSLNLEGVI